MEVAPLAGIMFLREHQTEAMRADYATRPDSTFDVVSVTYRIAPVVGADAPIRVGSRICLVPQLRVWRFTGNRWAVSDRWAVSTGMGIRVAL